MTVWEKDAEGFTPIDYGDMLVAFDRMKSARRDLDEAVDRLHNKGLKAMRSRVMQAITDFAGEIPLLEHKIERFEKEHGIR